MLLSLLIAPAVDAIDGHSALSSSGPHAPILIDGDAGFTAANGVVGGSGTPADPYRIDGWSIQRNATPGIWVRNTTAHFLISGVNVAGLTRASDGIRLSRAPNGTVRDSTVRESRMGLVIESSDDLAVANFTSTDSDTAGVRVDGGARVRLDASRAERNGQVGVWVTATTRFAMNSTTVIMGSERGLELEQPRDFRVENSTFERGRVGVELLTADSGLIVSNRFLNISGDGVFIRTADNITIRGNLFLNDTYGLLAGNTRWDRVENNTFERCLTGAISTDKMSNSTISYNSIANSTVVGLQIISSPFNDLVGNTLRGNGIDLDIKGDADAPGTFEQRKVAGNAIDGRPVTFAKDATNPVIPSNSSYLLLHNVSGATISGLNVSGQGQGAVVLRSSRVDISNSSFSGGAEGPIVARSDNVTFREVVSRAHSENGFRVFRSPDVLLARANVAASGSNGIVLLYSDRFAVRNSSFKDNGQAGLDVGWGRGFTAAGNRFDNRDEAGIVFAGTEDILIERNRVRGGTTAFQIDATYNATVRYNDLADLLGDGILPRTSHKNTIVWNTIGRVPHPMDLSLSNFNYVANNTLFDVDVGLYFTYVGASRIENNTVRNVSFQGLLMERSPVNVLRNNRILNARYGADIRSDAAQKESYINDIDTSNTIDGRPIRYIMDAVSPVIPENTSFVGLVNVSGEVSGLRLGRVSQGVLVAHSRDLVVRDSEFWDTEYGPFVHASENVTLENVTSRRGLQSSVWLEDARRTTIANSSVLDSTYAGVVFTKTRHSVLRDSVVAGTSANGTAVRLELESYDNELVRNRIVDNAHKGIDILTQAARNLVHRNDILRNRISADDVEGKNHWNDAQRGNFWSDYDGQDADCDGVGEKLYVVGTRGARDFRPLAKSNFEVAAPCMALKLKAVASGQDVMLTWRPPGYDGDSPVTGYRVLRGESAASLSEVASVGNLLALMDVGLKPNQTYFYAVRAVNLAGVGSLSEVVNATSWWVPPKGPDLAAEGIVVEPIDLAANESGRLRARVRNVGKLPADGGRASVSLSKDGQPFAPLIERGQPSPLQHWESFDLVADVRLLPGSYVARLTVLPGSGDLSSTNDSRDHAFVIEAKAGDTGGGLGAPVRRAPWDPGGMSVAAAVLAVAALLTLLDRYRKRPPPRDESSYVPRRPAPKEPAPSASKKSGDGKRSGKKPGRTPPRRAGMRSAYIGRALRTRWQEE